MTFDPKTPHDVVYGACGEIAGARYLQGGVYYNASGEALATVDGGSLPKPTKPASKPTKPASKTAASEVDPKAPVANNESTTNSQQS